MAVSSMVEIQDTISQIMAYEREPLGELEADRTKVQRQSSVLSEIDSSLEALQEKLEALTSENTFLGKLAASTDTTIISAATTVDAVQATYLIDVVQLAQVAKITSPSSLGLSEATYSVLQSSEEVNTEGATVDPNVTFASGTAAVGLDSDKEVVSGSFTINDATITVTGSDTIYTILSKINSSNADVTATFDADNDRVILTSTVEGEEQAISFGDEDTSGFLDALKLTETNGNPPQDFVDGTDAGQYVALADSALASGANAVQDGYFTINNITFSVDADQDSLNTVLNKINNSAAGVTAYYDDVTGKITLSSKKTGEDIYLENDTSNFLTKSQLMDQASDLDGTGGKAHYQGTQAEITVNGETLMRDGNQFTLGGTTITLKTLGQATVTVTQDEEAAVTGMKNFVSQFNNTMDLIDSNLRSTMKNDRTLMNLKRELQRKVFASIENSGSFSSLGEVGLEFVGTGGYGLGRLKFTQSDFRSALRDNPQDVMALFADDTDDDGLYDDGGFANLTNTFLENYTKSDGVMSSKVDSTARRIEYINKRIEREEERMEKREAELLEEFETLNAAIASMEQQVQSIQAFTANMQAITASYQSMSTR